MARDYMPMLRRPDFRLPWAVIEPHEKQALRNHGQTLERLAERGGLGFTEAVAILCDLPCRGVNLDEGNAEIWLREHIAAWIVSLPREASAGVQAVSQDQLDARIKQLMEQVGYPNSMALFQAFRQLAQEVARGVRENGNG